MLLSIGAKFNTKSMKTKVNKSLREYLFIRLPTGEIYELDKYIYGMTDCTTANSHMAVDQTLNDKHSDPFDRTEYLGHVGNINYHATGFITTFI